VTANALISWFARHSNGWVTVRVLRPGRHLGGVGDSRAPTRRDYVEVNDV
jgi:hypothetical protein